MTPIGYTSITDFLLDENFKGWVNAPTAESDAYWKKQMEIDPNLAPLITKGREIIKCFATDRIAFSEEEVKLSLGELREKIITDRKKNRKNRTKEKT